MRCAANVPAAARFVCAGLSVAVCIVNTVEGGAAVGGGKQGD